MADTDEAITDPETPITRASEHCRRIILALAGGIYPRDRETLLREVAQLRVLHQRAIDALQALSTELGHRAMRDLPTGGTEG